MASDSSSERIMSSEDKEKLEQLIETLDFSEELSKREKYLCQKCSQVPVTHYILQCTHRLCRKCYNGLRGSPCPICNCKDTANITQNMSMERKIMRLKVYCIYRSKGCQETPRLRDLLAHKNTCTSNLLPKLYHEPEDSDPSFEQQAHKNLLPKLYHEPEDSVPAFELQTNERLDSMKESILELEIQLQRSEKERRNLTRELANLRENLQASVAKPLLERLELSERKSNETLDGMRSTINEVEKELKKSKANEANIKRDLTSLQEKLPSVVDRALVGRSMSIEERADFLETKLGLSGLESKFTLQELQIKTLESRLDTEKKSRELLEKSLEIKIAELQKSDAQRMPVPKMHEEEIEDIKEKPVKPPEPHTSPKIEAFQAPSKPPEQSRHSNVQEETSVATVYSWKVIGVKESLRSMLHNFDERIYSEVFKLDGTAYEMKAFLNARTPEEISLFLGFMPNTTTGTVAPIYFHRRTFILVDQVSKREKQDIIVTSEPGFGDKETAYSLMKSFYSLAAIQIKWLHKKGVYVLKDTALIKLIVEPLSLLYKNIKSYDGNLLWIVGNFKKAKQDAIDGLNDTVESESIYTSERGYRMHFSLYLNGTGQTRDQYMALGADFLKGEYDNELPLEFHHRLSITIVEHTNSSVKGSISKSSQNKKDSRLSSYIIPQLALITEVEKEPFLKNDSIRLQITVHAL